MEVDKPEEILAEAKRRMAKGVEAVKREMSHLRAGRASPTLVEHIRVQAYGTDTPLNQLATISTPDATTILVSPYDKSLAPAVERAISLSELGLTPQSDGSLIRLTVPALTEERRGELAKVVNKQGEEGRVSLRNVRRDANDQIKKQQKAKDISEDAMHHYLEQVDDILEQALKELDAVIKAKHTEITEF
ncbi:ribosome recycling factor [bacterium]|nr:ribosome recycling factor [bacterium]